MQFLCFSRHWSDELMIRRRSCHRAWKLTGLSNGLSNTRGADFINWLITVTNAAEGYHKSSQIARIMGPPWGPPGPHCKVIEVLIAIGANSGRLLQCYQSLPHCKGTQIALCYPWVHIQLLNSTGIKTKREKQKYQKFDIKILIIR